MSKVSRVMATAKASVLMEFNAPLRLEQFPLPSKPEPGAALIRTEMAGICGTDVHLWKGQLPISLPVILGHETVGCIEQLGDGLERDWTGHRLELGDRVTWNSATSCGQCYYCSEKQQPTRCRQRRAYGIGYRCDQSPHFLGGYAQYHYLRPGTALHKIPDGLPTESVIGAGCALITAIHGVERICVESRTANGALPRLPSPWDDSVVIQGAGPVGIAALAVAKSAGAKRTLVIGGPRQRLELARRFGADHVINIEEVAAPADRIALARQWIGSEGADVVLECVGSPAVIGEGMEMCRDGGKYLVLGHYCDAGTAAFNPHVVTRKQLQVFGSWSSEPRHLKMALDFLGATSKEHPFAEMVTHRFPLEQANQALATTANWQSAKTVIIPN
ncbi:MAG TPA: zinc-binding dehydrogenase [Verrucomicrobiae bacterium]|nr:zinc-binding dehydrogenase [Verrucomicrobiae bacterium]